MTDKHTPKPWKSGGCVIYGPDGAGIADLVTGICNHNGRIPDETEANARLIAAAPELLEALERLLGTTPSVDEFRLLVVGIGGVSKEAQALEPRIEQHETAIGAARDAIKAAKGNA